MGRTVESIAHPTLLLRALDSRRKAPTRVDHVGFDLANLCTRFQQRDNSGGASEFVGQNLGRSPFDDRREFTAPKPMPIDFVEQRESLALGEREPLRFPARSVAATIVQQRHTPFLTSSQNLGMIRPILGQL
jgi:hypothetical protein